MNHNLDGVYFRVKRDDRWQNICFTDLTDEELNDIKDLLIDYRMFDSLKFRIVALQKNIKIIAHCADISAIY